MVVELQILAILPGNRLIFWFPAGIIAAFGDVPKWLKGADSKSARRRKACGGSNPSISAKQKDHPRVVFLFGYGGGFEPI